MAPRAVLALVAVVAVSAPPGSARAEVSRQVTYTVTAKEAVTADIYYREVDPPTWADYSHNPYLYSPKARVGIGPDTPWVRTVTLADPDRWAMVAATSWGIPAEARLRCELSVDGVVVATGNGPKGALCSIRHW